MMYLGLLVTALCLFTNAMYAHQAEADSPLVIKEQGSFLMSDLNNKDIADIIQNWLRRKRLDKKWI